MRPFYIFIMTSCIAVPRKNNVNTTESMETIETTIFNISDSSSRIIKGSPVIDAEAFPSYASIRHFGIKHSCGGIILDERRILTATHCGITQFDTVIVGGIKRDGSDKQQELTIKQVFNHPDYNPATIENDISVIELKTTIDFTSNVKPIEIGSEEEFRAIRNGASENSRTSAYQCEVVGHGFTDGKNSTVDQLQKTTQVYTNEEACWNYKINTGHCFLTRDTAGDSQVCQGDSGGPLYCNVGNVKKLFGVVSFVSATSCDKGFTGFTLPIRYKSFIDGCVNASPSSKLHFAFVLILISTFI